MASPQEIFESETPDQRKKRLSRERQSHHYKRQKTQHRTGINLLEEQQCINIRRHELGRMDQVCIHCGARFWMNEKNQSSSLRFPSFAVCCAGGKVNLPPLLKPPPYLLDLYTVPHQILMQLYFAKILEVITTFWHALHLEPV